MNKQSANCNKSYKHRKKERLHKQQIVLIMKNMDRIKYQEMNLLVQSGDQLRIYQTINKLIVKIRIIAISFLIKKLQIKR